MTLGLTMIVKNESAVLARALNTARLYADEIVIVDTGSTDNTVEIARSFTDKVFFFEWNDDFSAARNFAREKATADYWMWLDADDIVPESTAAEISGFMRGKSVVGTDAVMLPYVLSRDKTGKPIFSYYRERIIANRPEFFWQGKVHEAVALRGNIVRLCAPIYHGKPEWRDSSARNLDIYRKSVAAGVKLSPRENYYYARELYRNGVYDRAAEKFEEFIAGDGFYVNKIDACILLSRCYRRFGNTRKALSAALGSLAYGLPTGEACCEIGGLFFSLDDFSAAAYWYERALRSKPDPESGAFVDGDCYGFIPLVWLTVCYDRLGKQKKAFAYHLKAKKLRPDDPSVVANDGYFARLGFSKDSNQRR